MDAKEKKRKADKQIRFKASGSVFVCLFVYFLLKFLFFVFVCCCCYYCFRFGRFCCNCFFFRFCFCIKTTLTSKSIIITYTQLEEMMSGQVSLKENGILDEDLPTLLENVFKCLSKHLYLLYTADEFSNEIKLRDDIVIPNEICDRSVWIITINKTRVVNRILFLFNWSAF